MVSIRFLMQALLGHELEVGCKYSVLVTTRDGLCRWKLGLWCNLLESVEVLFTEVCGGL